MMKQKQEIVVNLHLNTLNYIEFGVSQWINEQLVGEVLVYWIRRFFFAGEGAIGTIIMGNIPADRRYPEAKKNAIIDRDSKDWDPVAAFKPVIAAAKAHGSIVIAQVTHAGRQTSNTVTMFPVSSSDVQTGPMGGMVFEKPRPLTIEEVEDVVDRFAYTSKVLYDAGCDGEFVDLSYPSLSTGGF